MRSRLWPLVAPKKGRKRHTPTFASTYSNRIGFTRGTTSVETVSADSQATVAFSRAVSWRVGFCRASNLVSAEFDRQGHQIGSGYSPQANFPLPAKGPIPSSLRAEPAVSEVGKARFRTDPFPSYSTRWTKKRSEFFSKKSTKSPMQAKGESCKLGDFVSNED